MLFRFFENRIDPFADMSNGTPPGTVLGYVRMQLAPYRRWLPLIALVGLLTALMESGLIFYSGRLIDLMTNSGPAAFWDQHRTEVLLALFVILLIRPALVTLNHLLLEQTLSSNLQEQVRWRAHKHLLGQSVGFFQNDFAGRLSNRVMQMGPAVQDSVHMTFEALWFSATYILGAVLILSQIDTRLALPLVLWVVGYGLYVRHIALKVGTASERWADGRSMATGRVVDAYSNIETVKLFAHDAQEQSYALSALRRLRLRFQRFLRLMTMLAFGMNAINGILILILVGPAIWFWIQGSVSVGEVAATSALAIRLNGMSNWIMWVTIRLFENSGIIQEGLHSIATPHLLSDTPGATALPRRAGAISVQDVTHRHGNKANGLEGVTLTIPAGQKLGIVGKSGAGKSTLANLLMRFDDPEQGQILIDGNPIDQLTQRSLRQQIGMVSQNSSLLHRSIRENLLYGNDAATEVDMIRAAKQARAHDFILTLRDTAGRRGYDAHVGERGVTLSGGQRQRIAIARVILKDAPILILDEATSALDSAIEIEIQQALQNVMQGKTVIVIAHRLSTLMNMDRIIVLENGRIIEDGSPAALQTGTGRFAQFWRAQRGDISGHSSLI